MGQPVYRISVGYANCELIVHNKKAYPAIKIFHSYIAKSLMHKGFEATKR